MNRLLFRIGALCLSLLFTTVACVPAPQGRACLNSDECPGERVCHSGLCLVNDGSGAKPDGLRIDEDGDGYSPPDDCNDTNPAMFPGAEDIPGDGIDQDCNGVDATSPDAGPTPSCDGEETLCDEACVDVETNPEHCGSCGVSCVEGVETCREGTCVDRESTPACDDGMTRCDDACVDVETNPEHCGECGVSCEEGVETCRERGCIPICATDPISPEEILTNCGVPQAPECVNTNHHRSHCGQCGQECPDAGFCQAGSCVGLGGLPAWCTGELSSATVWDPDEFEFEIEGGNNHIYWFCDGSAADAGTSHDMWSLLCRRSGGHLVTTSSSQEANYIEYYPGEALEGEPANFYTGAMWSANQGAWIWANGEAREYDPWEGSGPNFGGEELCGYLAMDANGANWLTAACNHDYGAICEFDN